MGSGLESTDKIMMAIMDDDDDALSHHHNDIAIAEAVPAVGLGTTKQKRNRKTNEEKIELVKFVSSGGSRADASLLFGVSLSCISKLMKSADTILSFESDKGSLLKKRKITKYKSSCDIVDKMVEEWIKKVETETPSLNISGKLIQKQALKIRNRLIKQNENEFDDETIRSLSEFKASNGWLSRFLQRHGMVSISRTAELVSVDPDEDDGVHMIPQSSSSSSSTILDNAPPLPLTSKKTYSLSRPLVVATARKDE